MNKTRSGFVAIVGRPNVGKSTLINALIGKKIAIMSEKPQTTRHNIMGILTLENDQIIFIDTPGLHKAKDLLNKRIDQRAVDSIYDADSIIFLVDRPFGKAEAHIIKYFEDAKKPVILVINKIDLLKTKSEIDAIIFSYMHVYPFTGFIPVSAMNKIHLTHLVDEIKSHLGEGPFFFDQEVTSDQSDEMLMSELIREKILFYTEEEVPHAVGVTIESLEYNSKHKTLDVRALIVVERQTQKLILLGKNGEKIKQIGTSARLDINQVLNLKVHLELWIKVKKDWRNKDADLKALGYDG